MNITFTPDELAQAILSAQRRPEETPNSVTANELARALGCGIHKARGLLRDAYEAGILSAEWVVRITPHGVARRYEGYVLAERPDPS